MTTEAAYRASYDHLMALEGISGLNDEKAFHYLGSLIDLAFRYGGREGTDKALAWSNELERRPLSAPNQMLLDYFRANIWENYKNLHIHDHEKAWRWTQPEAINQILHLRRTVRHREFSGWDAVRRAQVLTNLGNQLNTLGRFVEALDYWTRALAAYPNFGMALGNRGLGLYTYAASLFDPGHQKVFLLFAHHDLAAALSPTAHYEGNQDTGAKETFRQRKEKIEPAIKIPDDSGPPKLHEHSMGGSDEERAYREWALYERLFLNPLNDLGYHSIAASDPFTLPSFVTAIDEPPTWIGFFNQMKQEYVSARWMLYEGMHANAPHFSDTDVKLYNTLDYPSYSLAVERCKAAFRVAYSLFDKIAFFLNDYMNLGIPITGVSFRRVWYAYQKAPELRPEFNDLKNWPWRGLYWLSKDFIDAELRASAEPDAQELSLVRNCLEHRYLKIHEIELPKPAKGDLWHDRMAYSIQRDEFNRKTLRLLKLARAGLIYLSLGMHREERQREEKKRDGGGRTAPMHLDTWQDEWKQ